MPVWGRAVGRDCTGCPGLETCRERGLDIRERLRDTGSTCSLHTCTWASANYENMQNTKFVRKFAHKACVKIRTQGLSRKFIRMQNLSNDVSLLVCVCVCVCIYVCM